MFLRISCMSTLFTSFSLLPLQLIPYLPAPSIHDLFFFNYYFYISEVI